MFAKTTADFAANEIMPVVKDLEIPEKKSPLNVELLRKCADLGLLSVEIPERYSGLELDKATAMLIMENMSPTGSFATSFGAHAGIGTLPIVFFGTEEQKQKYLPKLAAGELIGAYALTEPWAGSDAMALRATAVLTEDGQHWILNGTKQFITNAGFADLFTVFAKIDGKDITAFLIEKGTPGLSTGPEEKKMGIHGSSTTQLIMEDVKIPVDNVLGERGRGHLIAFNILNLGRLKLGAGALGGAKEVIRESIKYGLEREQFNTPLVNFGMIREKIADMVIQTFVGETMSYRTVGMIDDRLAGIDWKSPTAAQDTMKGIEEYQIECSMIKVFGSEALDLCADEGLQILGGYGYLEEYPMEAIYRDSRINRLYEGTNEINRLIIPGTLLKWAMKGRIPLLKAAKKLFEELTELPAYGGDEPSGFMAVEQKLVNGVKKVALMTSGMAAQKYGDKLMMHQMVMAPLADIAIMAFAMESVWARAHKLNAKGSRKAALAEAIARAYIEEAAGHVELLARKLIAALSEGDMLQINFGAIRRFLKHNPADTIVLKDQIAKAAIDAMGYPFAY